MRPIPFIGGLLATLRKCKISLGDKEKPYL